MIRALLTVAFVVMAGTASAQRPYDNGARTYTDEQLDLARDIGTVYALVEFCKVIRLPSFRKALREAGLRDSDFYQRTRFSAAIREQITAVVAAQMDKQAAGMRASDIAQEACRALRDSYGPGGLDRAGLVDGQ